jgi:hypothetical protein
MKTALKLLFAVVLLTGTMLSEGTTPIPWCPGTPCPGGLSFSAQANR